MSKARLSLLQAKRPQPSRDEPCQLRPPEASQPPASPSGSPAENRGTLPAESGEDCQPTESRMDIVLGQHILEWFGIQQ